MWFYYIWLLVIFVLWFLVVLIFSETLQKTYFADFFTSKAISLWNEGLFSTLKYHQLQEFSKLKTASSEERLKVLEVGVGEGTNFEMYPENCSLTVLEYNEFFEKKFTANVNKFSTIKFEKFVNGSVEDMHEFEDNTFDVILCTHVLCSVSDVGDGLREIKRVLKEGGKFYFIEHVAYEIKTLGDELWSSVQTILQPFWKIIMCGCSLRKPTWLYLQNAGFTTVTLNREYPASVPAILRPHIWGCAVK